jgi:hypothetical protein
MFGANSGSGFALYDRRRDVAEARNVAGAHSGKVGELYGVVRRRSGGPPPPHPF